MANQQRVIPEFRLNEIYGCVKTQTNLDTIKV